MKLRSSLAGRVAVALAASALAAAAVAAFATRWLNLPLAALAALLLVAPLILWGARRLTRPWVQVMGAVRDGIVSLRDRDFSLSIARACGMPSSARSPTPTTPSGISCGASGSISTSASCSSIR